MKKISRKVFAKSITHRLISSGDNQNGVVLVFVFDCLGGDVFCWAVFAVSISNIEIQTATNNEKFQTAFPFR